MGWIATPADLARMMRDLEPGTVVSVTTRRGHGRRLERTGAVVRVWDDSGLTYLRCQPLRKGSLSIFANRTGRPFTVANTEIDTLSLFA